MTREKRSAGQRLAGPYSAPGQTARRGMACRSGARGAAMRFFLTRLADWDRADPGALVRPKDPMEYAVKLDVFRQAKGRLDLFGTDAP